MYRAEYYVAAIHSSQSVLAADYTDLNVSHGVLLRTEEDAFLKIHNYCLFDYCSSSVLECLVCGVTFHVVVPFFNRAETQDKSVADTVLHMSEACMHTGPGSRVPAGPQWSYQSHQ